jgi:hemerythrin-like metal-binding protein
MTEWNAELVLGEALIDDEHRAQIDLMTAFEKSLRAGDSKDDLVILLDRLIEFTSLHFLSEQTMMWQRGYPGREVHEQEHERLLGQVRKLRDSFHSGDRDLTVADLVTLRSWLTDHIRTMDRAFAAFLAKTATSGQV